MMVLNFAMPVYATTVLGLPGWVGRRGVHDQHRHGRVRPGLVVRGDDRADPLADPGAHQRAASPRRTSCMLGATALLGRALASSWCWSASVVYTLGELIGGPVTAALGAEAAPEHLRGRYFSLVQLAWNLAGTVAPVTSRGCSTAATTPLWLALLALTAGRRSRCSAPCSGRVMPLRRADAGRPTEAADRRGAGVARLVDAARGPSARPWPGRARSRGRSSRRRPRPAGRSGPRTGATRPGRRRSAARSASWSGDSGHLRHDDPEPQERRRELGRAAISHTGPSTRRWPVDVPPPESTRTPPGASEAAQVAQRPVADEVQHDVVRARPEAATSSRV